MLQVITVHCWRKYKYAKYSDIYQPVFVDYDTAEFDVPNTRTVFIQSE